MGGSTTQTQTTKSRTEPLPGYGREQLQGLLPQISGLQSGLTGTETSAFNALQANATQGNPYAPQIGQLATDLLGGGIDRTGMVNQGLQELRGGLLPYAQGTTDPYQNADFRRVLDDTTGRVMDQVRSSYQGAGIPAAAYGDFGKTAGEGITSAISPLAWQATNQLTDRKLGAINQLYGAGNTSAGLLSGLDQTALGNRQAGIGASTSALMANDAPHMRMLELEAQKLGIPSQRLAQRLQLMLPITQAGQETNSTQTGSTQVPQSQQIMGGVLGGVGALGATGAFGGSGWLASMLPMLMMSDKRVKENVERVGKTDDGLPIYKYNYIGNPTPTIGLMAQDVAQVKPEAVYSVGGLLALDYDAATRRG